MKSGYEGVERNDDVPVRSARMEEASVWQALLGTEDQASLIAKLRASAEMTGT